MIATFLQDDLATELKSLFADFRLYSEDSERVAVNVFEQFLPTQSVAEASYEVTDEELEEGIYDAESQTERFPYVLVRVEDGTITAIDGDQTVHIMLLFGVYDSSADNQGYKDILNMIHTVYERFAKSPLLSGKYECVMPIEWAMQEEESYPYFFGGMALTFQTRPITREDLYA